MTEDWYEVTLDTIAGGEAVRRFDAELEKVIENCLDPAMELKKSRDIHLVVKFWPSEKDRTVVAYEILCYSKLAREASSSSTVHMSLEGGHAEAYEQNIKQPALPFPVEPKGKGKKVKLAQQEQS